MQNISQIKYTRHFDASNVTSNTALRSASARVFPKRVAPWWVLLYNALLSCDYFSSSLCVYSKFGHHPHPLG